MVVDYSIAVREHDIDLAFVEGALVGLIETCPRDGHFWIENVAVVPVQQGNGFGQALLAHAERKALQAGYSEIRLLTNEAFQANVALYEWVGYVIDRREPFMGGTTIDMSKKLVRAADLR
jgi:GNAT superfamily N-acetyltransferase